MKHLGKVGQRRVKGMKQAAPIICERAGGQWNGKYCEGAHCELCGANGTLEMAHIQSRAQGGDESPTNLIALCHRCHVLMDSGDSGTRERMREKAREVTND